MATWTTRTIISARHEWEIPAAEPWGAFLGDLRSALDAAAKRYRQEHGLDERTVLPDDALRFRVTDDAIVIHFATEFDDAPRRGTRLCHDTDPATLKECALRAGHAGDHADANTRWFA